ncbi:hypothetical protein [Roseococcus sp.]|uniref:hypothetical protein n=1 Tax=Roseococcus sp. TaxID=2109646 RepID=UPI003BAABC4D
MRILLLALALTCGAALAQTTPEPEEPSVLPAGEAQEVTFYACTACHSTAIIRRSALTRAQWDGLMDWMVDKQGMNPLEPAERGQIVDYLAQHFGPRAPPRGRNPFLN